MLLALAVVVLITVSPSARIWWLARKDNSQKNAILAAFPAALISAGLIAFGVSAAAYFLQSSLDESAKERAAIAQAAKQKAEVLMTLRENLAENINLVWVLNKKQNDPDFRNWLLSSPLRTELWNSLGASGELRALADVNLIDSLSDSYEKANQCVAVYALLLDSEFGSSSTYTRTEGGKTFPLSDYVSSRLMICYQKALSDFLIAFKSVEQQLNQRDVRGFVASQAH